METESLCLQRRNVTSKPSVMVNGNEPGLMAGASLPFCTNSMSTTLRNTPEGGWRARRRF